MNLLVLSAPTVEAAQRIRWKDKKVFILDDGNRQEMRDLAKQTHCGYITRGKEWSGKQRYAKAGNVNNALLQTTGDFILVLDADQMPTPQIIEHCIGYFCDEKVAFVQSPQHFYNIPPGDPFGSDAPLFYGPILQGKDGWNAAFFCGSNGFLRREALLQLGITDYVKNTEKQLRNGLNKVEKELRNMDGTGNMDREVLAQFHQRIIDARKSLDEGQSFEKTSELVQQAVQEIQNSAIFRDIKAIIEDLSDLQALGDKKAGDVKDLIDQQKIQISREISLKTQSQEIPPWHWRISTWRVPGSTADPSHGHLSVTEDLATSIRLHAMGWKSVFHPEVLAYGLAPRIGDSSKPTLTLGSGDHPGNGT
jgi:cellulose synthase (UDP-forming)